MPTHEAQIHTQILSGTLAQEKILNRLRNQFASELKARGRLPGLAVLQVGDHKASQPYVSAKQKAAQKWGLYFEHSSLGRNLSFQELRRAIWESAARPEIDGLILQLPLDSAHKFSNDEINALLESIPPEKDADGLHPYNQGRLFAGLSTSRNWTSPLPATALGCMRLLEEYQIEVEKRRAVVIGKSRLVGFPVAGMLAHAGATVTLCHSKTPDFSVHTREADVVVVAAGKKHLLKKEHLKKDAIVVDVGIHVNADRKLSGDAHPDCKDVASAISPVPGGVGPLTVAMLIENVYRLFAQR